MFDLAPMLAGVDPITLGVAVAVSVALAAAGGALLNKKQRPIDVPEGPSPIARRGTWAPYVVGVEKLSPVVAAVGGRFTVKEKIKGASGFVSFFGGGDTKQKIFYEAAWHVLCPGPAARLHRIYADGAVIFKGPITPDTHASGTEIDLGKEGSFKIFWGDSVQASNPVDTNLSTLIGADSKWPNVCSVLWISKRLDTTPVWPRLEYQIEVRPSGSGSTLSNSGDWISITSTPSGNLYDIRNIEGTSKEAVRIFGYHAVEFANGTNLRLSGTSPDQDGVYTVVQAENQSIDVGGIPTAITEIEVEENLTSEPADAAGTCEPYTANEDDGANGAHIIYRILFHSTPFGLNRDTSLYDLDSLEAVGQQLQTEGIISTLTIREGDSAQSALSQLMQDLGVLMAWDTDQGKYVFQLLRDPELIGGKIWTIPEDMILPPLQEVTTPIRPIDSPRVTYSFRDRQNNYKDMTFVVSEDGAAEFAEIANTKVVGILTSNNFVSAQKIAERRSQETSANVSSSSAKMNREIRLRRPGDAVKIGSSDRIQRIMGIKIDPKSGRCDVELVEDAYSQASSGFENDPTGRGETPDTVAVPDIAFTIQEVPAMVNDLDTKIQVIIPRIRGTSSVLGSTIELSDDGSTFVEEAEIDEAWAGGKLTQALAATGPQTVTTGPEFTIEGPDISTVEDLSADTTAWLRGDQIAIINDEWFFIQKVTQVSGDTYRLDGLVRARYDTIQAAHAVDDRVYIIKTDIITLIGSDLLAEGVNLRAKSLPFTSGSALDDVAAESKTLVGKNVGPITPANLHVDRAARPGQDNYKTTEDIPLAWSYYRNEAIPNPGAGLHGAGAANSPSPQGLFTLRIKNGPTTVRTVTDLAVAEYNYTNANLQSDFGASEPASFGVEVEETFNGITSGIVTLTVTKI